MGERSTLGEISKHNGIGATLTCSCSEVIIKAQGGVEKIRAKVLLIKANKAYAVCKKCNAEVLLPLTKSDPVATEVGPRLYLDK